MGNREVSTCLGRTQMKLTMKAGKVLAKVGNRNPKHWTIREKEKIISE